MNIQSIRNQNIQGMSQTFRANPKVVGQNATENLPKLTKLASDVFQKGAEAKSQRPMTPEYAQELKVNYTSWVGYKGERQIQPAPDNVSPELKDFCDRMEVDWNTHVDPNKHVGLFD